MGDEGRRSFENYDLRDLRVLTSDPDPDFDRAVALAARALRTPLSALAVMDFDAGVSRIRALFGARLPLSEGEVTPLEKSLTMSALICSDVIALPDVSLNPVAREHPFIRAQGVQSLLAAPVMCPADNVVALLAVHDRFPRIWTAEEKEMILGIAHFCTEVILLRAALCTVGLLARRDRDIA